MTIASRFVESSKIQGIAFSGHIDWIELLVVSSWHGFEITRSSVVVLVNFRRFYERRGHGPQDNGSTGARVDRNVLCKSNCLASRNALSSSSDVFQSLKRRSNLPCVHWSVRCSSKIFLSTAAVIITLVN